MPVRRRNHHLEPWEPGYREPLRDVVKIPKPGGMKGHASEHWDAVVPLIQETVELLPQDVPALLSLCQWWAEYQSLMEAQAHGADAYKRSISMASCFKHWATLAAKFGLTPKDREKLSTRTPDEPDPAAEYIR